MVCWPSFLGRSFKRLSVMEYFGPPLLAILLEKIRIKGYAAPDLSFGYFSMVEADLECCEDSSLHVMRRGTYLVRRTFALDQQHPISVGLEHGHL